MKEAGWVQLTMQRVGFGTLLVAFLLAIGFLNTHTDELLVVVPVVAVAATVLGLAQPRAAWRWGLLVGLAVPGSQVVAHLLGLPVPYPNEWRDLAAPFVVIVPALIGAYVGSGIRTLADPATAPSHSPHN